MLSKYKAMKVINHFRYTFFIFVIAVGCTSVIAQDETADDLSDKIESQQLNLDSIDKMMADLDSVSKSLDEMMEKQVEDLAKENMKQTLEQNQRNLDAFIAEQNAKHERDKKRLWIRGAGLLVVLVVMIANFIRRRRAKNTAA